MFVKLLARDLAIVGVAVLAWRLAAPLSADTGAIGDLSGVLLGFLFGACGFLVHEWGHLLGALATRSAVQPPASLRSPFVFSFDSRSNSRRQFLVMSFASWPRGWLGAW